VTEQTLSGACWAIKPHQMEGLMAESV